MEFIVGYVIFITIGYLGLWFFNRDSWVTKDKTFISGYVEFFLFPVELLKKLSIRLFSLVSKWFK